MMSNNRGSDPVDALYGIRSFNAIATGAAA